MRKWDTLGQNGTKKLPYSKPPGLFPGFSGGDKTAAKQRHRLDIIGQTPEILRQKPSALTLKCPLLSDILSFSTPISVFPQVCP